MTDRQINAMAEAIHQCHYHPVDWGTKEWRAMFEREKPLAEAMAQAALSASDARFVPGLVRAIKTFDEAMRNGSSGPNAEKEKARALRAAHRKCRKALAALPEELRG